MTDAIAGEVLTRPFEEEAITVSGFDGLMPYRSFDENGNSFDAGHLGYRDYDGRTVRTMTFHPRTPEGEKAERTYSLGHRGRPGEQFSYVDHVDMAAPILDLGFEPSIVQPHRGGAGMFATFSHPDIEFQNVVNWDLSMFEGARDGGSMHLAIGLRFDGRMNKPISYTIGFFRVICTNGLITRFLDLGFLKQSPQNFHPDVVETFVLNAVNNADAVVSPAFPRKTLSWGMNAITRSLDDPAYLNSIPKFAAAPVNTLVNRTPRWYRESLAQQLRLAYESDGENLSITDLVNGVTNAANAKEDGAPRIYFNLDMLIGALINIVAIGAFKSDVELPTRFSRLTSLNI